MARDVSVAAGEFTTTERTTPGGVRVLAVHAAPGTDDGEGVHPGRSTADLAVLLAGADADLPCSTGALGHARARHEPGL